MPKLTKTYIDKLTAPADKEAFHWDTEIKGFGLRVTPTSKITYIVQGRVNGSSPRISIGPHGVFTVDQAREVAREHLRSMRMGIDPRAVAKKEAAQRVKDTEEDAGRALDQKMTTVSQVIEALVQAVHVTHAGQDVTRDMVHSVLNRVANGRRWKDVDDMLRMAQFQYRIDVVRGANNQVLYWRARHAACSGITRQNLSRRLRNLVFRTQVRYEPSSHQGRLLLQHSQLGDHPCLANRLHVLRPPLGLSRPEILPTFPLGLP
ncbi:Arm DNA-binding domain-containing protein [Uliginosibacterium sediminicola]|uniref:Arm DNA-binding domain-containing protein n=1 Tax=Uliginosibacterium sediminicola TaxID=2024550 RepID=A0ABU9YWZ4_9RHOO